MFCFAAGFQGPGVAADALAAVLNLESLLLELGRPVDPELLSRIAAAAERREGIPTRKLRLILREKGSLVRPSKGGSSTMAAAAGAAAPSPGASRKHLG